MTHARWLVEWANDFASSYPPYVPLATRRREGEKGSAKVMVRWVRVGDLLRLWESLERV